MTDKRNRFSSLQAVAKVLKERLELPLPGKLAHDPMRARFSGSGQLRPTFKTSQPPRLGGVLIVLYEEDEQIKFPLIKRPVYDGVHSGQISLPGGKVEVGENSIEAAFREAEEEIGVFRKDLRMLGILSEFHLEPSNFIVQPVVAMIESIPSFVPDPIEVESMVIGSLSDLMVHDALKEKRIVVQNIYELMAPHFELDGETVWGATAMILNELRSVLNHD